MLNVSYNVTQIVISGYLLHFRWKSSKKKNNVFLQLSGVHAPYIL